MKRLRIIGLIITPVLLLSASIFYALNIRTPRAINATLYVCSSYCTTPGDIPPQYDQPCMTDCDCDYIGRCFFSSGSMRQFGSCVGGRCGFASAYMNCYTACMNDIDCGFGSVCLSDGYCALNVFGTCSTSSASDSFSSATTTSSAYLSTSSSDNFSTSSYDAGSASSSTSADSGASSFNSAANSSVASYGMCGGFTGFLDPSTHFSYFRLNDYDTCLMGPPKNEDGHTGVDGHIIWQAYSATEAVVVESTHISYSVGNLTPIATLMYYLSNITSNTTGDVGYGCGDPHSITLILSNPIAECTVTSSAASEETSTNSSSPPSQLSSADTSSSVPASSSPPTSSQPLSSFASSEAPLSSSAPIVSSSAASSGFSSAAFSSIVDASSSEAVSSVASVALSSQATSSEGLIASSSTASSEQSNTSSQWSVATSAAQSSDQISSQDMSASSSLSSIEATSSSTSSIPYHRDPPSRRGMCCVRTVLGEDHVNPLLSESQCAALVTQMQSGQTDLIIENHYETYTLAKWFSVEDLPTFVGYCSDDHPPQLCGDGKRQSARGEQCDQGTKNSWDRNATCRPDCTVARCGDGIIDGTEECDDGPVGSGQCTSYCLKREQIPVVVPPLVSPSPAPEENGLLYFVKDMFEKSAIFMMTQPLYDWNSMFSFPTILSPTNTTP